MTIRVDTHRDRCRLRIRIFCWLSMRIRQKISSHQEQGITCLHVICALQVYIANVSVFARVQSRSLHAGDEVSLCGAKSESIEACSILCGDNPIVMVKYIAS